MNNSSQKKSSRLGKGSGLSKYDYDIVGAAENNDIDRVVEILKEQPDAINNKDVETSMTALHWAAANRNLKIAEALFSQEDVPVDMSMTDDFGRYAFDLANEMGYQKMIDLFFENAVDMDDDNSLDLDNDDGPLGMG